MAGGQSVFGSVWYHNEHFGETLGLRDFDDIKKVKALVLWGGEDISPFLYGQQVGYACAKPTPSLRDRVEVAAAKEAVRLGIPIIGVCRGAQLLCALAGGTLWQHVENHAGYSHGLKYKDKRGKTNTAHHQMMRPPADAEVLAVATEILSPEKYGEGYEPIKTEEPEPEIVHFPSLNAVGVQGHPEWLPKDHFLNVVMKEVIQDKLKIEVGY